MNLSNYPLLHASFYEAKNVAYFGFPFEVAVKDNDRFVRIHDDITIRGPGGAVATWKVNVRLYVSTTLA